MDQSEGVSIEMETHVIPENSVHSMPQSVVFTEVEQRLAQKKPPRERKHKKIICLVIVALFCLVYYIMVQILKPPAVLKVEQKFEEANIQFDTTLGHKVAWIKQKLDHFNETDKRVWKQRLLIDIDLNNLSKTTPIFLNIPPLRSAKQPQSYINIRSIRNYLKGAAITLEPRYFGQSLPFGVESSLVKNLKYLTIEQIMEDIAYLIDRIISKKFFRIGKENPWIISGDTYSGMIVVWMRAKYPELTVGAYVSSPIFPTATVPQISQKLYVNMLSGGKRCKSIFLRLINEFEQKVYGPKSSGLLLDIGRGLELSAEQAMQMLMDKMRTFKRNIFISACSANNDQETVFNKLVQIFYYTDMSGVDPIMYSLTELNSVQSWQQLELVRNRRAFEWLRCSQLGLFEIKSSSDKKNLNFRQLTEEYFRKRCQQLFQASIWPNTSDLVKKYANVTDSVKNLLVVHGTYDIWLPYGFLPKNTTSVTSFLIKCSYCGQNFDIEDQIVLLSEMNDMRLKQKNSISNWISQKRKLL